MTIFDKKPDGGAGSIVCSPSGSVLGRKEVGRRRSWSTEDKLAIVAEVDLPGETIATVARRHDMNADHLLRWLERAKEGTLARRMKRADKLSDAVADGGFIDLGTFGRDTIEAMLGGGGGSGAIEIELPGSLRVKLPLSTPPGQLINILRALKAA